MSTAETEVFERILGRLVLASEDEARALLDEELSGGPAFDVASWHVLFHRHAAEGHFDALPDTFRARDALAELGLSVNGATITFDGDGHAKALWLPALVCLVAERAAAQGAEVSVALLARTVLDATDSFALTAREGALADGALGWTAAIDVLQIAAGGDLERALGVALRRASLLDAGADDDLDDEDLADLDEDECFDDDPPDED